MSKKITIGILAHVDAGKTTLSEALLYLAGEIRNLGRVDHKNTYLDTNAMERERGITIFSKQARFSLGSTEFILLDTPGHVDFSAETERTLSLLDYAILLISAPDGIQNHTRTLWQLLEYYSVPTFILVNKTDISDKSEEDIMAHISKNFSDKCVSFSNASDKYALDERLALVSEGFLESFLSERPISKDELSKAVSERRLFPCLFGSALRMHGIDALAQILDCYTLNTEYTGEDFGAIVYKIARISGNRMTYMKITGGTLSARDEISYVTEEGKKVTEKVTQIRLYTGDKYTQVQTASAGEICAVCGLSETFVGEGLGYEKNSGRPVLEPVLSYSIKLPQGADPILYFPRLKEIEEEEPSLHLVWNDLLMQIEARLMGEVQIDVIQRIIHERLGILCEFDTGRILYKEKISSKAIGVGHFEPIRHYAEVQLLLEPQPRGTGLVFDIRVPENTLETNWKRLILTHLCEKEHKGVLIGAPLTDTKITLVCARAHQKHTQGGDFREATGRAVRCGLMRGGCVLLEPYYKFRLEVPAVNVGRAMTDLQNRSAEFEIESSDGEYTVICGRAPVAKLHDYAAEITTYTKGLGRLFCTSDGYYPCTDAESVIKNSLYDPLSDIENTPHSVFCAHGAGFVVHWQDVDKYKHLDAAVSLPSVTESIIPSRSDLMKSYDVSDKELESIMMREFGPIKRKKYSEPKSSFVQNNVGYNARGKQVLIIDGYNLIYSWDELRSLADFSLEGARNALMDILSNYVAYTKAEVTLVFDAYLVKDGRGSDFVNNGYRVVYTKEDQTADTFIEKMMSELGPDYTIRVVTGDRLLQISAVYSGILRMTASEFEDEVRAVGNEITEFIRKFSELKE